MRCLRALPALLALWSAAAQAADADRRIEGRVVDAVGRPVAGVDVAPFWSANGLKGWAEGQAESKLDTPEAIARFWGDVGAMEPWPWSPAQRAKTDADGRFRLDSGSRRHHVLAMDAARASGGLGIVRNGQQGEPITIVLAPLVRVQGQVRGLGPGEKPGWSHVYAERAEEAERPVDSFRVASCGSFAADFSLLLPPGRYSLHAYNNEQTGEVMPHPALTIAGTEGTIDLGTLQMSHAAEALVPRLERVRAEKHLKALKDHVGQSPPALFADDARGVPRDWQPGRSGKWQVLEFWGMDCPACLSRILPDLIAFHEAHAAQADRFEIVSVFLDVEGKIRTVADMDKALALIIRHAWGGKTLPFPIVVDPSYRTAESFGLSGYGAMILINPEGKIVPGDLDTLRSILDGK